MSSVRCLAFATVLLAPALHATSAFAQGRYESVSSVPAADFLPRELLKGPHHTVASEAERDGVLLSFRIESDFGSFEAPSREMALLRIDEVAAIAKLKELGSSEIFARALAASVEQKAETVARVVTDPGGTVKGMGRGLKRLWGKGKDTARDAADTVKGEGSPEPPSTGGAAGRLLGVDKSARAIAKSVGADPYTSNELLRAELERLGKAAAAGGITGGLGTRVPGLDAAASAGELAWSLSPEDLRARNQNRLDAIGCGKDCQKAFLGNAVFTPSLQARFIDALAALDALDDRAAFVTLAAGAENEEVARFYCGSMSLLGRAGARGRAIAYGRVPAALGVDGSLVVAAALDHLAWTQDLAEAAARTLEGASRRELWITGALTPRTRAELAAIGWTVHERTPLS